MYFETTHLQIKASILNTSNGILSPPLCRGYYRHSPLRSTKRDTPHHLSRLRRILGPVQLVRDTKEVPKAVPSSLGFEWHWLGVSPDST